MIEFTDVVKSYREGNDALKGVNMQIEDGEFCFLVGPSGSGKSTIIKLITGELKPTSGTVHVNGYSLERIRKREVRPEGCLSIPGRRGEVLRFREIDIHYSIVDPKTGVRDTCETVRGFTAVIFQHECDHLDGILYTDRLASEP